MAGEGYRPVRLPPKANAAATMSAVERDDVERRLACPCPCTLDVFTCRTSMPCGFSPAMHGDVLALAGGGHTASEILTAFESVYGERILLAPKREGFNWVGYLLPFAVIGGGAVTLAMFLRRWSARSRALAESRPAATVAAAGTAEELRRLDAIVRDDSS